MCSGAAVTASCATPGAGMRMTPASPAPAPGWSSSRPRRTTAAGAPPPASRCSRWTSGVILTFYNHHNTGGGRVQADRVRGPGVCKYPVLSPSCCHGPLPQSMCGPGLTCQKNPDSGAALCVPMPNSDCVKKQQQVHQRYLDSRVCIEYKDVLCSTTLTWTLAAWAWTSCGRRARRREAGPPSSARARTCAAAWTARPGNPSSGCPPT